MPSRTGGATASAAGRRPAWPRRHPRWALAATLVVLLVLGGALVDDDPAPAAVPDPDARARTSAPPSTGGADRDRSRRTDDQDAADLAEGGRPRASPRPSPRTRRAPRTSPAPATREPAPEPRGRGVLVARVVDGDTVELGDGRGVRLVGIDTPERGECGFDRATDALARLVEGRRVRLTRPVEDRDRYGRLLRYLDVGPVDPGLRLVRRGLAVARYDSRDGYGFHPRQPAYVAADRLRGPAGCAAPAPSPPVEPVPRRASRGCATGYSPCVPSYPPDLDCGDLPGPVRVRGADPHGLDGDGDGRACES